jgi:CubicO group peptidase (beta-lactamase class C family)
MARMTKLQLSVRSCAIFIRAFVAVLLIALAQGLANAQATQPADPNAKKKLERRQFQDQELITAKPFGYIFNAGDPPRIIWRDVETVRELGCDGRLHVRWFDADLNEADIPKRPGRWSAWIEGNAPNGTPFRRLLTFYCRPPGFLFLFPAPLASLAPPPAQPIPADVWREHEPEISHAWHDLFFRAVNDSEQSSILLAGLSESKTLGHSATDVESAAVRNNDYNLALKLKVLNLHAKVRDCKRPRKIVGAPVPVLHEGTMSEADMTADAPARIEEVCRQWARDTGEPFVTLVARHGVIVVHGAFGKDPSGKPIPLDYRCIVFSITKSVTAILFSQFVDQGLIDFDESVADVFPDYPKDPAHVPTFRQCFTHTSGLSGHGDWGGCRNPQLENIILNAIDVNEPGKAYNYSGMGFDLAAKALEIVAGKSFRRVYQDYLFAPLGFGDVLMDNASSNAQLTARELGILAQWLCNHGRYGDMEFISPQTFQRMLPEQLGHRYPGVNQEEGIGMHWLRHVKAGRPANSTKPEDLIFSLRTVGHGSFSACIFLIDLDRDLIVVQARKQAGPRQAEWEKKFFQTVADQIRP